LKVLTKARRSYDAAKSLQMLAKTPHIYAVWSDLPGILRKRSWGFYGFLEASLVLLGR